MNFDFYGNPPTGENLAAAIAELRETYRQLKVFPIGKSAEGREIPALCIGNPDGAVVFVGATHGLEWLTTLVLMRFCERVLHGLATGSCVSEVNVSKILSSRSLTIIPCLNPDGVEIAVAQGKNADWQANANGVDLNHNFDAGWRVLKGMEIEAGITSPGPTRYGGLHPHSEPETAAVASFCVACRPRTLYSFHSQGEEIYYSYGERTPPRSRWMARCLAAASGYTVSKPEGLASHGGLKDWFIEKFGRPGFTIEIGRGKNPLGIEQFDRIYNKIEEMLVIATMLN